MSDKVVDAVRDLLPAFEERAQQAEDARRVSAESIASLQEAGFFRLLQPKRFGGFEADPMTFYTAVRMVASACGSTGWVSSVLGVHPWHVALFSEQAQDEVWDGDPHTRGSSSYAPTGKARLVEGGVQLSGRWSFSSGCDHATWVLLGGIVTDDEGNQVDFRTFLLPLGDYRIEDVWDTVGLRGTGSNDIVVEDVFVPEYRSLSFADTSRCICPGQQVNDAPLYRLPYGSVFSYSITTPIIGMAEGAYSSHVGYMKERVRVAYGKVKAAEDPFSQVRIADAASEIDAAWLQLTNNIGQLMRYASAGEKIPMDLRVQIRRDQVRGTTRSIHAIDGLFENSGGRALAVGTPIQRYWRDAHAGRVHAINDPERALSMYGSYELGLKVHEAML